MRPVARQVPASLRSSWLSAREELRPLARAPATTRESQSTRMRLSRWPRAASLRTKSTMARSSSTLMWGTAPDGRRGQRWAASSRQTLQSAEQPASAAASLAP
eukprot:9041698-Lingulodinium_polyedra.AAC.1